MATPENTSGSEHSRFFSYAPGHFGPLPDEERVDYDEAWFRGGHTDASERLGLDSDPQVSGDVVIPRLQPLEAIVDMPAIDAYPSRDQVEDWVTDPRQVQTHLPEDR